MTNPQNQNSSAVLDLYRIVNEKFKMFMTEYMYLGLDLQAMTMTMLFAKQLFPFLYVHLINQTQYSIKHRTQTNLVT